MKKVCIIYTGGTIGMVQTERGFAPEQGALNKELLALKDLSAPDMPKWDLVSLIHAGFFKYHIQRMEHDGRGHRQPL